MADAPFVIGSVAVFQELLREYLAAEFNARDEEFRRAFGGSILMHSPTDEVQPSKTVEQPRLQHVGGMSRLDLTSTAAKDSTAAPDSSRGRGTVRSATIGPLEYFDHAIRGYKWTQPRIAAELARQFSNQAINYRKTSMYKAFRGALGAMATSHTEDETGEVTKTLQLDDVIDAKALVGDAGSALTTLIVHSAQAKSLLKNVIAGSNFSIFQLGDRSVLMGTTPVLAGLRIIIDDDVEQTVSGSNINYRALLLGPGAGWIAPASDTPKFSMIANLDKNALAWKQTVEDHFGVGVHFSDMDANNSNSTDAQLIAAGNWTDALSDDHRDFKLAEIVTQDG